MHDLCQPLAWAITDSEQKGERVGAHREQVWRFKGRHKTDCLPLAYAWKQEDRESYACIHKYKSADIWPG